MERDDTFKFQLFKLCKVKPGNHHHNKVLKSFLKHANAKQPKPRSGHRIVADSANLYSFGGYSPCTRYSENGQMEIPHLFQELWKYNLASNMWVKLKPIGNIPTELASPAMLLSNNSLLVFGGSGVPFGSNSSNKLHICQLKKVEWNEIRTKGERPLKQYGQGMVLDGEDLYVIGGTTGYFYTMDVHKLNLRTLKWEFLEARNKPEERYRHEVALYEDCIYIFGGGTSTISYGFEKVPVFHIKTHQWENRQTTPDVSTTEGFPSPRRSHGCVHYGDFVYICGGYNGQIIFSDIWRLSLKTFEWKKLPAELSCPVFFHSAAVMPSGQMFVFGGVNSIMDNTRTNGLYSMWLTIPSLRDMCWTAILHYAPQLPALSKEKLLSVGIPRDLLDRVDFLQSDGSKGCF